LKGILALLLLLAVGACASKSKVELTPMEELPEANRAIWAAWNTKDSNWPMWREQALADPRLTEFLIGNLWRQMVQAYDRSDITPAGEVEMSPFDRARGELLVLGEPATPILVEMMGAGDGVVASLSAGLLKEIGAPAIEPTLAQLERPETNARRRAIELLGHLPYARAGGEDAVKRALADRLENDDEWIIRATAAIALGLRGGRDRDTEFTRGALSRALGDDDEGVSRRAAAALAALGDPRAIPALINYLDRGFRLSRLPIIRGAQGALLSLSGEAEERDVSAWRQWWREHRTKR
jgi:HEAT repeat protein